MSRLFCETWGCSTQGRLAVIDRNQIPPGRVGPTLCLLFWHQQYGGCPILARFARVGDFCSNPVVLLNRDRTSRYLHPQSPLFSQSARKEPGLSEAEGVGTAAPNMRASVLAPGKYSAEKSTATTKPDAANA